MTTPTTVTIHAKPNGPLIVVGPITLVDPTGATVTVPPDRAVALCRCGQSSMKPFCDGSHSRTNFTASDPAPAR
jgi:CDGSH-type Zn-finger protein